MLTGLDLLEVMFREKRPNVICFRNLGMNIVDNEDKRNCNYPFRLVFGAVGTFMWYIALLHSSMINYNDVDKMVATMAILVQTNLAIIKCIYFLIRKPRFVQLNTNLETLAMQANSAELELWNAAVGTVLPITSVYLIACLCSVTVCSVFPLLRMFYVYIRYGEVVHILPLPGIFPFDITLPYNFALTYVFMASFAVFGVSSLVATDGIFSWYVFSLAGHMKILRFKLAKMLHNGLSNDFHYEFVHVIFYHRRIIDLAAEFDVLFAFIVFLEVTTSCMQLCFLVYELASITDVGNFIFLCLMTITIMIQLLIFCLGGEQVQTESELICDDLYMLTPWQSVPPKVRKLLLLPLIRSQRELSLTGYFFTANRSLLVWIFRTAGSFAAILFAMKSKQRGMEKSSIEYSHY